VGGNSVDLIDTTLTVVTRNLGSVGSIVVSSLKPLKNEH
jgi:hypothetical protein